MNFSDCRYLTVEDVRQTQRQETETLFAYIEYMRV